MRRRAHETRDRIEAAAVAAFADAGFDGASTGEIAERAGVTQQLVIYHYGTKLDLWKVVAARLFGELRRRTDVRLEGLEGVDDPTRARLLVREFVRFSAEVPELARFMIHEGNRPGPRLSWLIERHIEPQFGVVRQALARAQRAGWAPPGDPAHLAFLIMGSAVMCAAAAQAQLLTGRDPAAPDEVEAYADLVVRAVLPGAPASQPS